MCLSLCELVCFCLVVWMTGDCSPNVRTARSESCSLFCIIDLKSSFKFRLCDIFFLLGVLRQHSVHVLWLWKELKRSYLLRYTLRWLSIFQPVSLNLQFNMICSPSYWRDQLYIIFQKWMSFKIALIDEYPWMLFRKMNICCRSVRNVWQPI